MCCLKTEKMPRNLKSDLSALITGVLKLNETSHGSRAGTLQEPALQAHVQFQKTPVQKGDWSVPTKVGHKSE